MSEKPKALWHKNGLLSLVVMVATAIVIALAVQALVVKPYLIPSGSMLPTLQINERILVNRLAYHFQSPQISDVIVFHPPKGAGSGGGCAQRLKANQICQQGLDEADSEYFVKRIVAVGGDEVQIQDGQLTVNGQSQEQFQCPECKMDGELTVPEGYYYMMGDNRAHSLDSRFWGPIPEQWIIGKAFISYWPPQQFGLLN